MGGVVKKVKDFAAPILKYALNLTPIQGLFLSLAIGWLLRPKGEPDSPTFGNNADDYEKGVLVNKQSNDASIPVVYGERLIGGTRVFIETSGTDNTYMYMCIVLAEGEINDITEIKVNDKVVTWSAAIADNTQITVNSSDSNFYKDSTSHITLEPHYGTDGQASSTLLSELASWGSNHKLSGLSYLALKIKYNADIFGSIPTIQAKVQGKKVVTYNGSLVAQTASYSTNPAWCLLDYLTNTRYGKGLTTSEIDLQSFYDSSLICETQVTPYSGGSAINLFDMNYAVDTSKNILENSRMLLKGCRGYLPYSAGKYKLIIEGTGTATITLDEDNILDGIDVRSSSKGEKYNRVICSYVDPNRNWQVNEVQYPPIDDSGLPSADQHATMKASDGGYLLEGRFSFTTLTSKYQAQEMAEIILRRSRDSLSVALNVDYTAYDLAIGDIVNITHASVGFSSKPFRVLSIKFNPDYTLGLELMEHQDSYYTWAEQDEETAVPNTNLPDPYSILPPASLTLSDQLIEYNDGTVIVALDVLIGASLDQFVDKYQVEYKLASESDYKIHSVGSGLNQRVLNVIDQETYDVRVKSINSIGVSSTYTTAQRVIIGGIEPPSDVTDFNCNIVGEEAHLSWSAIPDLDLAFYEIRYSSVIVNPEWSNSVLLVEKVSRPATSITVPARVGSYLIKAVDKLGNYSSLATSIITNIIEVGNYNAIQTVTESPTFSGTHTNTVVSDSILKLGDNEIFDSAAGNFDDETVNNFDDGVVLSDLYSSGNYEFTAPIDIGVKQTVRITASLTQSAEDLSDLFDSRSGNFDDAPSNFDGDVSSNSNAHLEIALSDNGSTYTDWSNFVIADYSARYFKFRIVLTSSDNTSNPLISALAVSIDMKDRIFSGNDITSGTGTYSVVFTNPFYSANYAVGITAQGMSTGDYFLVTNKTTTGFDVAFKNSSDTGITKDFDYLAKGY